MNHKVTAHFFIDKNGSKLNAYLLLNNTILYKLPEFYPEASCQIEKINAVAFTDLYSDGFSDIIIIAEDFTGTGDIEFRYETHYFYEIFYGFC